MSFKDKDKNQTVRKAKFYGNKLAECTVASSNCFVLAQCPEANRTLTACIFTCKAGEIIFSENEMTTSENIC